MSKVLTVFGATGNQGRSVIENVLANPTLSKTWKLRAVTRDISKPSSTALKEKGIELVTGDFNDLEALKKTVKGSDAVFGMTNYWETMDGDVELKQGKNLVDACKASGVDRFIFSSLPFVSKLSNGENNLVKHFDSKARVEEYAREQKQSSTFIMPAVFMGMIADGFQKQDNGNYVGYFPYDTKQTKVPFLDPLEDTGLYVAAILLNLDETLNRRVLVYSQILTPDEVAEQWSAGTGHKAAAQQVTHEVFGNYFPNAAREELIANMKLIEKPGYYIGQSGDDTDYSLELVTKSGLRKPTTFADFAKRNFKG